MSGIGPFLWLVVLWVVLWRSVTPATLITGMVVAAYLVRAGRVRRGAERPHRVHPLAFVHFVGHVLYLLVQSNLTIAKEVLTPTDRTHPGVIAVEVPRCSHLVLTLVANCISLTPGTVTLDADHEAHRLTVHVLHLRDADAVRAQILRLHELAAAGITPVGGPASDDPHRETAP